jgi:hypothetical protein
VIDAVALAPLPPSGVPDGLIIAEYRDKPINIEWGGFDDAFPGDRIEYEINLVVFDTFDVSAGDLPPYIGVLPADAAYRTEEDYQLTVNYLGFGSGARSDPVKIKFDYHAPGVPDLGALLFDDADDIPGSGITKAKFRTDDDGERYIYAYVASYGGMAPGDQAVLTCNGVSAPPVVLDIENEHIVLPIYEALLEEVGSVQRATFTYVVTDRAGNVSNKSLPVTVAIQLSAIDDLQEPLVPSFDDDLDDPLIDHADAWGTGNAGMLVIVPWNDALETTDTLIVSLDNENVGPVTVGSLDEDIAIVFPYEASLAAWAAGTSNGATDERVDAAFTYTVYRNGAPIGTSPAHPVVLNLYQQALDPEPETPENERLTRCTVVSASGERDVIPVDDFDKAATVEIRKLTNATYPPQGDSLAEGDTLRIYYGTQPSFDFTVPALGDKSEPLAIALSADLIKAEGSGDAIPVYYEVIHDLGDGGTNANLAPTKEIVVRSKDTQPGRGHLDAGTFPDAVTNHIPPAFHQSSTIFAIPDYANRDPQDEIVVFFQIFRGPSHTEGETPYPGKDWTKTLPAGTAPIIDVTVPASVYNLVDSAPPGLTAYIHIHATYKITKRTGDTTPVTSDEANVAADCRFSDPPPTE